MQNRLSFGHLARAFAVLLGFVATSGLGVGPARAADDPAALILDIMGASEPELFPFSELVIGTKVALADDATLSFVHYGTCREVTVTGGEITMERRRYRVKGGRVDSERNQECPREVALNEDGTAAGLLMRGGDSSGLHLGLRPKFVIVGAKADGVVAARFKEGEQDLLSVSVERRVVAWPDGAGDLADGNAYSVELVWRDESAITYPFEASGRNRKARVILRLD